MLTEAASMYRIALILHLLLMASPAWSGAWLREKDAAFTAASLTAFRLPEDGYDYKTSLYAEWGYSQNLTVGFDFEQNQDLYGHALIFARVPVADLGQWGRFAAEFGAGAYHKHERAWAQYKVTLSYGKGFQSALGSGWIAIDAAIENRTHDNIYRKLDLTTGLSSDRLINPLIQIETAYRSGHSIYWKARPSVMIRTKDSSTTWVLGVERNDARKNTGIKLALWNEF
ncbi:hypothetical protein [Ruegeria faecimaris]|uniref:hypothetical protein n=1 Tax=Ruegeria faecimaris TaxID=686389 RepID=UPI00248FD09D|nr:hypothetical protein [Ruegeria faecimaris]